MDGAVIQAVLDWLGTLVAVLIGLGLVVAVITAFKQRRFIGAILLVFPTALVLVFAFGSVGYLTGLIQLEPN